MWKASGKLKDSVFCLIDGAIKTHIRDDPVSGLVGSDTRNTAFLTEFGQNALHGSRGDTEQFRQLTRGDKRISSHVLKNLHCDIARPDFTFYYDTLP